MSNTICITQYIWEYIKGSTVWGTICNIHTFVDRSNFCHLRQVTFVDKSNVCPQKLLLSDKINFCWQKQGRSCFCQQMLLFSTKVTSVLTKVTFVGQKLLLLDKSTFVKTKFSPQKSYAVLWGYFCVDECISHQKTFQAIYTLYKLNCFVGDLQWPIPSHPAKPHIIIL